MKKQISPVVTVVVILVVVIIVALLWNHFSGPSRSGSAAGRGGMSLNFDPEKMDLDAARKNAAKERDQMLEQRRSGGAPGR